MPKPLCSASGHPLPAPPPATAPVGLRDRWLLRQARAVAKAEHCVFLLAILAHYRGPLDQSVRDLCTVFLFGRVDF